MENGGDIDDNKTVCPSSQFPSDNDDTSSENWTSPPDEFLQEQLARTWVDEYIRGRRKF